MKRVYFSHNWNNKLDCKDFTTLRLSNDNKYVVGEVYEIWHKEGKENRCIGEAVLKSKRKFHASKINQFIAYLDTGYSADETKKIIQRMYKKENPLMDFCLFVKVA